MGKIIYLMGKSSTGKDTIYKELLKNNKVELRAVVTYTTRPIRAGERDGVEYHFTNEAGYADFAARGKIVEDRVYHTFLGEWRYFTVDDGSIRLNDESYIMIGTPEAYGRMKEYFGEEKMLPVMIELDDGVRLQRALDREKAQDQPQYEELCRRFLADSMDFAREKMEACGVVRSFCNDDLHRCLEEILAYIKENIHVP